MTVTVKVTKQLKNTVSERGQADVAAWIPAPVFIYNQYWRIQLMKNKISFIMVFIMVLCSFSVPGDYGGIFPVEVSAKASASMKKKAAKAYRNYMKNSDRSWFCMIDMDRDGLKELIVTKNYYPKQNPRVEELDILKYIKGGLCCIGSGDYTNFGYLYNKKTKRIHGLWGNCGSIQD